MQTQTHRCLGQTQNAAVLNVQTVLRHTNKGKHTDAEENRSLRAVKKKTSAFYCSAVFDHSVEAEESVARQAVANILLRCPSVCFLHLEPRLKMGQKSDFMFKHDVNSFSLTLTLVTNAGNDHIISLHSIKPCVPHTHPEVETSVFN